MRLSEKDLADITQVRLRSPATIDDLWQQRRRRPLVGADGRMLLVAADHPARGALGVRSDARAMASRSDTLHRLATALSRPGVDGVLATPDILEDLLLLGLLEQKVVVGSMNRVGLQGASFELDDRFTAYSACDISRRGLDGGKMLLRIDLADDRTGPTLQAAAQAITQLAEAGVMAMVEPFMTHRVSPDRVTDALDPDSVITSIHIAAGLGGSSSHTWLKLPVVPDMPRVLDASTLPSLLLGGDPAADARSTYSSWREALRSPAAAGLVVGRALLYPQDGDVAAAVDTAVELTHGDSAATSPGGRDE